MKAASLTDEIVYNDERPAVQLMFETETGKEIRIVFKEGQFMREHKTPYPIVVEIYEGAIDFGVNGQLQSLKKGDLVALEGNVPHDLVATEDSIVRLTLTKSDSVERVKDVAKQS